MKIQIEIEICLRIRVLVFNMEFINVVGNCKREKKK